jgi:predicted nucleic acid-binding protein
MFSSDVQVIRSGNRESFDERKSVMRLRRANAAFKATCCALREAAGNVRQSNLHPLDALHLDIHLQGCSCIGQGMVMM